jgi:hypothetical protein
MQRALAQQSLSLLHEPLQVVAPHAYGQQSVGAAATQFPPTSHWLTDSVEPVQLTSQSVLADAMVQPLLPSQVPGTQTAELPVAQALLGSVPATAFTQFPDGVPP